MTHNRQKMQGNIARAVNAATRGLRGATYIKQYDALSILLLQQPMQLQGIKFLQPKHSKHPHGAK